MIEEPPFTVTLEPASLDQYPMIQNMLRFYVYDVSKECGGDLDKGLLLSDDSFFKSFNFKRYFEDDTRRVYLIKVCNNVAGFIMLNQVTTDEDSDWNMGEFFIFGKYQGKGIGKQAGEKIWQLHPGKWEVYVIPENGSALIFWENVISNYTGSNFTKETKLIDFDQEQPSRVIFTFNTIDI